MYLVQNYLKVQVRLSNEVKNKLKVFYILKALPILMQETKRPREISEQDTFLVLQVYEYTASSCMRLA